MDNLPLGPATLIFGMGLIGGVFLKKFFFSSSGGGGTIDLMKRAARLATLRAQGLGRDHKMVFVVRQDLGMGKGKMAAQCCHAAVMCYQKALVMDMENLDLWEATGAAKVCLKGDGDDKWLVDLMKRARDLNLVSAIVRDGGHTQVAPGTMTVLGIGPAPVEQINKITGHLKLL